MEAWLLNASVLPGVEEAGPSPPSPALRLSLPSLTLGSQTGWRGWCQPRVWGSGCRGKEPEWRRARARVAISLGGCAQRRWQAGAMLRLAWPWEAVWGPLESAGRGQRWEVASCPGHSGTCRNLPQPTAHASTPFPETARPTPGLAGGSGPWAAGVGVRHEAGMWQPRGAGVPSVGPLSVCPCSSDQEEGQQESGGGGGTPRWPPAHPHTQVSPLSLCPVVPRPAGDGCHGNPLLLRARLCIRISR